jgi:hypothetical protein
MMPMRMRERLEEIIQNTTNTCERALAMSALTHLLSYRSAKHDASNPELHARRTADMQKRYVELIRDLGIRLERADAILAFELVPDDAGPPMTPRTTPFPFYRRVESIRDEFDWFGLDYSLKLIAGIVATTEKHLSSLHDYSSSPKYRGPEQEMLQETVGILLGVCFVSAQSAMTRTISTLEELREAGAPIPFTDRRDLLRFASEELDSLNINQMIEGLANYFKHSDQWSRDWVASNNNEAETIKAIIRLGLSPDRSSYDNIVLGAEKLGLGGAEGPKNLSQHIKRWRGRVADAVEKLLSDAGVHNPQRPAEQLR